MKRWLALAALLGLLSQSAAADIRFNRSRGFQRLYFTGTLVNCACASTTVAETLATYTLPAGILANVGDTIHIVASGAFAATTDTKNASVKMGGSTPGNVTINTTSGVRWYSEIWATKTGPNAQSFGAIGATVTNAAGTSTGTMPLADTAPIVITVTALNSTTTAAASITLQYMTVDFVPGS
jgi:hypothetical protein